MPDPGARSGGPQPVQSVANPGLWETLRQVRDEPVNFYEDSGRAQARKVKAQGASRISLDMAPTPIQPDQLVQAYDEAGEFLKSIEAEHPVLAQAILNNPNMLHLLPEVGLLLGSSPVAVDVAGSLIDAMPNAVNYRSYAETMFETPVQQDFWQNVASNFDSSAKDVVSYLFAGLQERGANRVASLAFAWLRNNPIQTKEDQDNLLLRLWNWSETEQQTEIHDTGFFGALDFLQERAERLIEVPVNGLISWLGSPEEAIRRSGLTLGQQGAYQMGLDPDDTMWSLSSGAIDAIGEVLVDPLNVLAGIGVGLKAAKTIPLGTRAVQSGRAVFAARSALPILGRRVSPVASRSLTARATYAFRAKTVDQLFDTFGGTRAGREAFELLQQGNRARFIQRFPQLEKLPESFYDAAKFLDSPEDMSELMKHVAWADNMADPAEINKAQQALDDAQSALERVRAAKPAPDDLVAAPPKPLQALELDVLRSQMRLDNMKASPSRIFVVADLPTKPARFKGQITAGREGHIANVARRWAADLTQGVPNEINLFDSRKGLTQVRQLLEHYGVELGKKDELLNKFLGLDIGERQAFMLDELIPAIGDATRNPLLRYRLVEIYRRSEGVRAFNKGLDEVVDATGNVSRLPILPSNMQQAFPFPVREVDRIIQRYNQAGRLGGALTMGRRGLTPATQGRRAQLLQRLRNMVGDRLPDDVTDEDLYAMAYSWLGQGIDPRGWVSKLASGANTRVIKPLDLAFRKAMLGLRPIQWLFKVVLLEEPMRAHVYEMPNMYTKPLGWMQEIMSNHYLNKADDWGRKQIEWVDNVRHSIMDNQKTVDGAVDAIREAFGKAADDILGDSAFTSIKAIDRRLASWMHRASLDSQQAKLIPGSNITRRWRAHRVNVASDIKSRELLKPDFRPVDDIQDIMHKSIYTMFGDELATSQSGVIPFNWDITMATNSRHRYGHAWGSKVAELTRDPSAQWALRRMVAAEAGNIPAALRAEAFMETSTWKLMKGNIRRFFPDEATDAARVERYFDEKVQLWVEELLKPVLSQQGINRADFLGNLAEGRRFNTNLNGHNYDIDLRSAGSARRQLADLVVDQGTFARTIPFPEEIASVPFDFRFLDGSTDRGLFRRFIDWNIQTFGEDATQAFNRRPFWRAQRRRWLRIYKDDMGLPDALAAQLASDKASKLTNYVMYDLSEAPTVVKKLNNMIPFFGATYEVLSTWAYKLPAATGGYWALGAGGFARKIDRLMRAFVSTGITKVSEQDGQRTYELQFWREPDTGTPLGDALSKIGYHLRRTPENAIAQLLAVFGQTQLQEGLPLSEAGYGFSLGNPLDPTDFGILSFAQFHAGLSPASNWIFSSVMGKLLPAADVQRVESGDTDVSLADMAERLDVDPDDLARANHGLIPTGQYAGLFSDDIDPADIIIIAGSLVTIPGSSLFETLTEGFEETFQPFGQIDTPAGILRGLIPSMYHHVARGLGLVGTPSDGAWLDDSGELDSVPFFGLPIDKAAINSQILEAFYYMESTEAIFSEQIFPLQKKYEELVARGGGAEADAVKAELERLSDEALKRATDMAGGAMILRGLAGGFFPNTGRVLRQEMNAIDTYWDSKDFATQLQGNDADGNPLITVPLRRLGKPADVDEFFAQTAAWLDDESGDSARRWMRQNHPDLMAYLQPKTFWGPGGVPPEITSYEDYLDQIRSGDRQPVPLAVAIQRHLHTGVETDYWIDFVNNFGNDPQVAASVALDNYGVYSALQDERSSAKDALYMSDDLHGGEYLEWLEGRGTVPDDSYASVEEAIDRQREAYDMLQELLDLELDSSMTADEIRDHRKIIKTTLARFGEIIDELEGPEDEDADSWRNPYELAMNAYWTEIYEEFSTGADAIWEQIGASTDTEATSLAFENLKLYMNEWANRRFTLFGRTDITYPSPLDIKWQRKNEDEQRAFVLKRSTLPLEWLNLDDVGRIMSMVPPQAASFFPQSKEAMEIYTQWTLKKNEIEEMAEAGEITETQRRDLQDEVEQRVNTYLTESGRGDEVLYMNLWPIEQLHVLGLLPAELEYLMPQVRFVKESLAAEGKGPRSQVGDKLLLPVYNAIVNQASVDEAFGAMLRDLGLTLFDESAYDAILPRLLVGDFNDA